MIKDITIGQYFPGDSIIHRLDPRVKIITTMLYITALFFINKFPPYILAVAYIATILIITKIPPKIIFKGIKPLIIIIMITMIFNIFTTKGEMLFEIGFLHVSKEGLRFAVFMVIRIILLVMGTSLLTLTTSPIQLTDGLEKLMNPLKVIGVPAHELAMMMTISLRFIPTLMEETDKIMKAQMARGADFESGNIIKRAKNLVPLLVPLFIVALRRADELAIAMEARCYRGGDHRTRMNEIKMGSEDWIVMISMVIYFGGIISTKYIF